jgi:hypothetical protein
MTMFVARSLGPIVLVRGRLIMFLFKLLSLLTYLFIYILLFILFKYEKLYLIFYFFLNNNTNYNKIYDIFLNE